MPEESQPVTDLSDLIVILKWYKCRAEEIPDQARRDAVWGELWTALNAVERAQEALERYGYRNSGE